MEYTVDFKKLSHCDDKIRKSHKAAQSGLNSALRVSKALIALAQQTQSGWYSNIGSSVKDTCSRLETTCKVMSLMAVNLETIAQRYQAAEAALTKDGAGIRVQVGEASDTIGNLLSDWFSKWYDNWYMLFLPALFPFFPWFNFPGFSGIIDWIKGHDDPGDANVRYKVDNIVFDDEGSYGGDQGHAKDVMSEARRQELYKIIRGNLGYSMTDAQLDCYLKKLNSEGCGYVALVNTIFVAYAGQPELFEKTFGYPMYYNGDLNYDALIADLYSSEDNKVNGKFDKNHDYDSRDDGPKGDYNYKTDTTGEGTNPTSRAEYITDFMKDHGVDVTTESRVAVTPDNFEALSKSGKQVIVAFHNGDLLNMDGSVYANIDGGHAMTVTGVTKDGYLIVSSWGKEYMIDPKGTSDQTWMSYATVEYHI